MPPVPPMVPPQKVRSFPAEVSQSLHRSAVGFVIILPPFEHVPSEVSKNLPSRGAWRGLPKHFGIIIKQLQHFVFVEVSQVNSLG